MIDDVAVYVMKAEESLAGAEAEFAVGRFNNCANRCYYACFQAAIAALIRAGIRPPGDGRRWGHEFVQSQFASLLINRRKVYPGTLRDVLGKVVIMRLRADYHPVLVTEQQIARGLGRSRTFVAVVNRGPEGVR